MARSKAGTNKPTAREGSDRVQFSITMPVDQRFKLEALAGLYHMGISDYINMIVTAHLETVPDSTWETLKELEQRVRSRGIQFAPRSK